MFQGRWEGTYGTYSTGMRGGLIVPVSEDFGALDLTNSNAITVTEMRKFTNILED